MSRYFLLIPAAGVGSRLGNAVPKQYLPINGRPMIQHTIDALAQVRGASAIYVLLSPDDTYWDAISSVQSDSVFAIRCGGPSRAATVRSGLEAIVDRVNADDWILVHDAARPCIEPRRVEDVIEALRDDPVGGLRALPIPDTVKQGKDGRVISTVPRENLWLAQTPQMFRFGLLREALSRVDENASTDEAQAVEAMGLSPRLLVGNTSNFKVTYPEDVAIAEAILRSRAPRG